MKEAEAAGGAHAVAEAPVDAVAQEPGTDTDTKKDPPVHHVYDVLFRYQESVYKFYNDTHIQIFVAFLICANFMTTILEQEIDAATPKKRSDIWDPMKVFYNVVFIIELLINMYGSWFFHFWKCGWNIFDFVVVVVGVIDWLQFDLGPLRMLRMMRAFRVFRLFRRIKSINKIVVSIMHAIPGMGNAIFINALFMCIYAVLAVDLFGWSESAVNDCLEQNYTTARGNCHNTEYYSTFGRSLYTLFQVLTGDSWSEAVVRPILYVFKGSPGDQFLTALFFVSFVLLNSVVLLNVVVAVLLDKMAGQSDSESSNSKEAETQEANGENASPADEDIQTLSTKLRSEIEELEKQIKGEMRASHKMMEELGAQVDQVLDTLNEIQKL